MKIITLLFLLISNSAYAGGVMCNECPAESTACMPQPNCFENHITRETLPSNCNASFKVLSFTPINDLLN